MTIYNLRPLTDPGEPDLLPRLFRSGAPFAGGDNVGPLRDRQISSVIDLRDASERALTEPWSAEVEVRSIPVFRDELASIQWHTLSDLYREMFTTYGAQLAEAVSAVSEQLERGSVLIHCTAGKDRTGVLAALIQSLLGVEREAILADYVASSRYLTEPYLRSLAAAHDIESMPGFAAHRATSTDPDALAAGFRIVDQRGGVRRYLREQGVPLSVLDGLVDQLRRAPSSPGSVQ